MGIGSRESRSTQAQIGVSIAKIQRGRRRSTCTKWLCKARRREAVMALSDEVRQAAAQADGGEAKFPGRKLGDCYDAALAIKFARANEAGCALTHRRRLGLVSARLRTRLSSAPCASDCNHVSSNLSASPSATDAGVQAVATLMTGLWTNSTRTGTPAGPSPLRCPPFSDIGPVLNIGDRAYAGRPLVQFAQALLSAAGAYRPETTW